MSAPHVAPEQLMDSMQQEVQQYLESVMQAVNNAPDGDWVAGSEEQVRDLSAEFRRQAFERAVQLRINEAEASFSPSAQSDHGQTSGQ